ncbi:MAG: thioesterase family protein [Lachnospiraceae bacterium]|nr:thioesterase family protein [Lachnospiraceae bacterium]
MLEVGTKGHQEITVTDDITAAAMVSGTLPVYATPCMISLIEATCWKSIEKDISEDESTVGTMLNVKHLAATPVGMKVWCDSKLVEVDGRRLLFEVEVFDEAGKVGEGTHERFIIKAERFLEKANAKLKAGE